MSPCHSLTHNFLVNESLPSDADIVTRCRQAGYDVLGFKLVDEAQSVIAWVKYGPNVTIPEALTQDRVAKALCNVPSSGLGNPPSFRAFTREKASFSIGYIVMEYIDTPDCDKSDVDIVAKAVQALIDLRHRTRPLAASAGACLLCTSFLSGFLLLITGPFKTCIIILTTVMNDPRRVDLVADAQSGLCLCPCDIHPRNFKKLKDGRVVALDFSATFFIPPSFVGVAMQPSGGQEA
ncbi:hypothetical protein GLOTRDRAFT_133815 [Gloeophyllum trabeum ATCC 11539]|uniref:Aminoglycoside phosphotransferase domain-containing protein n=1 Tax=Gloeophyllum trabeum (strain ATCC 11539 / FP-39264 / Madison 617) TaxID=670483 RepID=S7PTF8_GLOTA|nr:uncharacterized protein GLOTRDRAFT_133815 [Gloeophyllum trabeum ATCC 11539]EPQ50713.1 hypothetical protein GLOTRDRAFT_133815 [Gloeophyllum trabeum ATCC 11539]